MTEVSDDVRYKLLEWLKANDEVSSMFVWSITVILDSTIDKGPMMIDLVKIPF